MSVLSQSSLCVFPVLFLRIARMFACAHEPGLVCASHAWVASRQMLLFAWKCFLCWNLQLPSITKDLHCPRTDETPVFLCVLLHWLTSRSARRWICSRMNGTTAWDHVGGVNAGHRAGKLTGWMMGGTVKVQSRTLKTAVDNIIQKNSWVQGLDRPSLRQGGCLEDCPQALRYTLSTASPLLRMEQQSGRASALCCICFTGPSSMRWLWSHADNAVL